MSTTDGPTPLPGAKASQAAADRQSKKGGAGTSADATHKKGLFGAWSEKWQAMPRQKQWLYLIVVVLIAYALPVINPRSCPQSPATTSPGVVLHGRLRARRRRA